MVLHAGKVFLFAKYRDLGECAVRKREGSVRICMAQSSGLFDRIAPLSNRTMTLIVESWPCGALSDTLSLANTGDRWHGYSEEPNMDRLSMVQLGGLGDQRTFIMSGRIPQFGDAQQGLRKPTKPYARQDLPRECGLRRGDGSLLISGRHRHRLAE